MDALVGNVGNRARHHRCLRKPAQYLGYVLFWFLGHFHHHPTVQKWVFTLLYLAGASVVAIQPGPLFYTQLPRIALIDYCGIFILAGILWVIAKFAPVETPANAKD